MFFCAKDFALTVRSFWHAEGMRLMRWVEMIFFSARMRWKQLRRTFLDDMWEGMGWDDKSWDEVTWGEKKSDDSRWDDEMRWSVECEVWSVKKTFSWRCVVTRWRTSHVLGRQHSSKLARLDNNTRRAHGACKFYRWKRSLDHRCNKPNIMVVVRAGTKWFSAYHIV